MAKLSEVLTEATWGKPGVSCLMFNAGELILSEEQAAHVGDVAARLFPERAGSWRGDAIAIRIVRGIEFNNHPATTWDDVDKVIATYEMEVE